jgi:acetolactate synthase small subunit
MRWCFWAQMEDCGRMEARVMQVLDRLQAKVVTLSSTKLDGRIFLSCVVDAEERQAERIQALLKKVHGMYSVKVQPETDTTHRMIALFRILVDISDRAEVLHFINSIGARGVMVRPSWVAFEMVGIPQEIEGIYQSLIGYGIVDLVSSSCVSITHNREPSIDTSAVLGEAFETAPE